MSTVLAAISDAIGRWDRLTGHPAYRIVGVLIGLVVFVVVLNLPTPEGLTVPGQRTAAVALLMALWWVGRVLPLAVTALLPIVAFPLLGVLSVGDAAAAYTHPLNVLMLGGMVIGHAMEEADLHQRLVSAVLQPRFIRVSPSRVVLAMMVACAVLSGLVSNTATMLMLLPVALSLARICTDDPRQRTAFVLALAYSASIGGLTTIIGTPPNAVLASLVPEVTFATWSAVGIPFVILALPVAWFVVTRIAIPLPRRFAEAPKAPELPRWSLAEGLVLGLLGVALVLWFTRSPIPLGPLTIPGWSEWFPPKWTSDALVAIGIALLLFFIPALPKGRRKHEGSFLLTTARMEKGIPWNVLILLGGGFSLAAAVKATALTEWLSGATAGLTAIHDTLGTGLVGTAVVVLLISLFMTFTTEVTSNTATSQIVLPVLLAGVASTGVDPLVWMGPATFSASCAFMMPVATAPNAIAAEGGDVSPADMAWAGLVLNLLLVALAVIVSVVWVPLIFG